MADKTATKPSEKPLKSKFFRVATEGATTDGRAITREQIEQMAKNFDPAKYGARVWVEHMRGLYADSPFRAHGDVMAVENPGYLGAIQAYSAYSPDFRGVDIDGAPAAKSDKLVAGSWLEVRLPEAPAPVAGPSGVAATVAVPQAVEDATEDVASAPVPALASARTRASIEEIRDGA